MMTTPFVQAGQSLDVVLLTRPGCSLCDGAHQTVTRLARRFPLTVAELDIDSPAGRALAERGHTPFVPAVYVGGEPFAYGHIGERSLRQEIERRLAGMGATVSHSTRRRPWHRLMGWLEAETPAPPSR